MPDNKNIWKSRFEDPNLDSENWLEPSDSVLKNIELAIGKEKKPKRKLFILYWLFGSIMFLSICAVPIFLFDQPYNIETNLTTVDVKDLSSDKIMANKIIDEAEDVKNADQVNIESKIDPIYNQKIVVKKRNSKFRPVKNNTKNQYYVSDQVGMHPSVGFDSRISSNSSENIVSQNTLTNIYSSNTNKVRQTLSTHNTIDISETHILQKLNNNVKGIYRNTKPPVLNFNGSKNSIEKENVNRENNYSIHFGIGYHYTTFILNNEYLNALDPADFNYVQGKGFNTSLFVRNDFSKRWYWSGDMSYIADHFSSSHNSFLEYDSNLESVDLSNHYELTMATPLGLMQSDFIVNRVDLSATGLSNITVDIENKHQTHNLSLTGSLGYYFINNQKFKFGGFAGIGLNYLFEIQNQLNTYSVNESAFHGSSSFLKEEQSFINTITPFSIFGLEVFTPLKKNYTLGFRLSNHTNLKPIYKQNNFETTINKTMFTISIGKSF